MEKIKFRGKRIDNGEWVYGNLIVDETTDKYYITLSVEESENIGEEGYLKVVSCEVIPETVGQYTNIKELEGIKKIYKDDIVLDGGSKYVVVWHDSAFRLEINRGTKKIDGVWKRSKSWANMTEIPYSTPKNLKVIGNIFDNPNLINDDNN